ncbi:MAG: HAD hydrolase-like protein [Candidatus Dojkabacteria bacterium]|nr:HAD hydrolase-like protein [Candidatus Dojkabacteria bacterium]MDQ7020259.1 HAD hydrolase-like protein [Candidatus Dojkabacteria bacterium]
MYKILKDKKVIIFDYDDTLVKTRESKLGSLVETAEIYNLKLSKQEIISRWHGPYLEMIQNIFGDIDDLNNIRFNLEKIARKYLMQAYTDAIETVNSLLKNFKVSILTSSERKVVIEDLIKLGFSVDSFSYIQTSEDTDFHKPDPRVFENMISLYESIGISKEELLYVGSDMNDYLASSQCGIDFTGINRKSFKLDEKVFVINELVELIR